MQGFFPESELVSDRPHVSLVPHCGVCGLYRGATTPKMPVTGDGARRVLIVAEAPGVNEDKYGTQLIGNAGALLRNTLDQFDVDLDRDCWKTNALICWPGEGNPSPTDKQIKYCRPNLQSTLDKLQPEIIVTLGGAALKSLIGPLWKEDPGGVQMWSGHQIPCQELNAWICPTWHPSYLLHMEEQHPQTREVLELWFRRHLEAAFSLKGRPWKNVPDYRSLVDLIYDPHKAAKIIRKMIKRGGTVAFDYETNMLKPDGDESEIVCASVCWEGKKTIAFPWFGAVLDAMRELLTSDLAKIAANMKFEAKWTQKHLGVRVNHFIWDTVLGAHIIDNRPGITSLKFQAFARLGVSPYNKHIEQFFTAAGGNAPNQIKRISLSDLLLYCGMDSLLEYKLAQIQMEDIAYVVPDHN